MTIDSAPDSAPDSSSDSRIDSTTALRGKLTSEQLIAKVECLRKGARRLRGLSSDSKSDTLLRLARDVSEASPEILTANQIDLHHLPGSASASFRDRLTLSLERVEMMCESLRQIAALPDPVGEMIESKLLGNGLKIRRVRAPLGVILMIFESRPNVILEAFSLSFKSGNVIALRGGSDSNQTAQVLYRLVAGALGPLAADLFYGFEDYDRDHVKSLLSRPDLIDVVLPRGGEKLIAFVQANARMPIIKNDRGLCHAYVDESADLVMASRIVINAKTQRPGVCNSLETVLVNRSIAKDFYRQLLNDFALVLKIHACQESFEILSIIIRELPANSVKLSVRPATSEDWDTEYLDLILNAKIVDDLDAALAHIETHSSRHSETIITKSETNARRFQNEIDSAAVYWNASTRFTDGFEFGLGGELGISTQKLHVRGPVGLRELTTPRWLIDGDGQIRS